MHILAIVLKKGFRMLANTFIPYLDPGNCICSEILIPLSEKVKETCTGSEMSFFFHFRGGATVLLCWNSWQIAGNIEISQPVQVGSISRFKYQSLPSISIYI